MNKKLLLALQASNQKRLEELKLQLGDENLTPEQLQSIEDEIKTLSAQLDEIAVALEDMEDETTEPEARAAEPTEPTEPTEPEEPTTEPPATSEPKEPEARGVGVTPEARSKAMSAVKTALSTRNAMSTKKRDAEMRSAFANFVVGNISEAEARSLGIVTGQGSVTVPQVIASEIIAYAQEENLLRKYGTTHKTKAYVKYPVLVKKAAANATKTERSANMPETDIEFDEILLDPTEFDALATVSKKLVKLSGVNIEEIVVEELKKAYVRKEINYMFDGNEVGAVNPGSLRNKAVAYYETEAVDIDAGGLTNKLLGQLVKMKGQLKTAVRKKAMWIINSAAFTALEGLLDANGRPILYESPDGMGYKLLGHRLDYTDAADGVDASVPVFYFGDFSAFHIQDVIGQMEIQRLVEQYAAQNKIGFQVYNLLDGQLIYSPIEPAVYRYEVGETAPVGP